MDITKRFLSMKLHYKLQRVILQVCLILLTLQGFTGTAYAGDSNIIYYFCDGGDRLYSYNRTTGTTTYIGNNSATLLEAMLYNAYDDKLYGTNGGVWGELDLTNANFINTVDVDGGVALDGAIGPIFATDIDGLTFDTWDGTAWASHRINGSYDILFKIDPLTGLAIRDAFGTGVDYVVIDGSGVYQDIDDISIDPTDGKLYTSVTTGGGTAQLVEINKYTGQVVSTITLTETDVEGLDFASDGTLYAATGGGNTNLWTIDMGTGTMTNEINVGDSGNCGDVEAVAATTAPADILSGTVWEDIDSDQTINNGETGIAGVDVILYYDVNGDGIIDAGDIPIQTTTTDGNGDYSFLFAANADLLVEIDQTTLPTAYGMTTDNIEGASFTDIENSETDPNNNFGAVSAADCDGDGMPDFVEGNADSDGDGVNDACDLDSDNDGILDSEEGLVDSDGDGIPNMIDLDSDNDGIPDAIEANGGSAPTGYDPLTGMIAGTDTDGDGLLNSVDSAPTTQYGSSISTMPNLDNDGDGTKNYIDLDADNDGILDVIEAGGTDANGDGIIDGFVDVNGVAGADGYHDPLNTAPLPITNTDSATEINTLPNFLDIDSDDDGIDDSREGWSTIDYNPPAVIIDADGDGIIDAWDVSLGGTPIFPVDTDNDGMDDYTDLDSENDTVVDNIEGHDANMDGVADTVPSGIDADNDGLDDAFDPYVGFIPSGTPSSNAPVQDTDGTEDLDWRDIDDDGDMIPTSAEVADSNNNGIPDYLEISDIDGDGIANAFDLDNDNDGIPDIDEDGGAKFDPTADEDGDGIPNYLDPSTTGNGFPPFVDTNNDGIHDVFDTDLDGLPDFLDLDSDNDGIADIVEAGGTDSDNDGEVDYPTPGDPATMNDADGDGLADEYDPNLGNDIPNEDTDGDGITDAYDLDSDNDGIADLVEVGGVDTDGDGMVDTMLNPATGDTDTDGWADIIETTLLVTTDLDDPTVDFDGDGIPNHLDLDADNDGIADVVESGGTDSDDDGMADDGTGTITDVNEDGWDDNYDNGTITTTPDAGDGNTIADFTTGPGNPDLDVDGQPDFLDLDSDNDGIADLVEVGGVDTDGDGIVDEMLNPATGDTDTDGWADVIETTVLVSTDLDDPTVDFDGDGIANHLDLDADNDGIPDVIESGGTDGNDDGTADDGTGTITDANNDGWDDAYDNGVITTTPDAGDGNTIADFVTGPTNPDLDGDGQPDFLDLDSDNDGIADLVEVGGVDTDGDGIVDPMTTPATGDTDTDGWADIIETTVLVTTDLSDPIVDFDGDGVANHLDIDADNDGINDVIESGGTDGNGDGMADDGSGTIVDANIDGWDDSYDNGVITTTPDGGDGNSIPDFTTGQDEPDFDGDGQPNFLDIDADDDGIVDNSEGQPTVGYIAPTTDSDGDGLNDAYEQPGMVGTFGGEGIDPENTDGTDNTDYLDLDTDNDGELDFTEGHDTDNNAVVDPASPAFSGLATGIDADNDGLDDGYDNNVGSNDPTNTVLEPESHPDTHGTAEQDWREINQNISGMVWHDANQDGIQDPGELPIAGATVELYDDLGVLVGTTTTDPNGAYIFLDIPVDDYIIEIPLPATYNSATLKDVGSDEMVDSDIDYGSKETATIVIPAGGAERFIDAGFFYNPLSVELVSFTGTEDNCSILLEWITASEKNNELFVILKSTDNITFTVIGRVEGNGTTNQTNVYHHKDENLSGTNYYRIDQYDYDGTKTSSQVLVKVVDCGNNNTTTGIDAIYPNPVLDGEISIRVYQKKPAAERVVLTDQFGRIILDNQFNLTQGNNTLRFNVDQLPAGTYFIQVGKDAKKFVKLRD